MRRLTRRTARLHNNDRAVRKGKPHTCPLNELALCSRSQANDQTVRAGAEGCKIKPGAGVARMTQETGVF